MHILKNIYWTISVNFPGATAMLLQLLLLRRYTFLWLLNTTNKNKLLNLKHCNFSIPFHEIILFSPLMIVSSWHWGKKVHTPPSLPPTRGPEHQSKVYLVPNWNHFYIPLMVLQEYNLMSQRIQLSFQIGDNLEILIQFWIFACYQSISWVM